MAEKAIPALKTIDGPTENFTADVTVTRLNGTKGVITFTCVPRTVTELAKLNDELRGLAKVAITAEEGEEKPEALLEELVTNRIQSDVSYCQKLATGWSVSDSFTDENLSALEDKFPGTIRDLHIEYSRRINGDRTKNS